MLYSELKLKSNSDRAPPCFKPFLMYYHRALSRNTICSRFIVKISLPTCPHIGNLPLPPYVWAYIHDSINCSRHMGYIIPKLSSACNTMSSIKPSMSLKTLKITYCYFNAIISYGLPFWRNSPHSVKIFRMQWN